MKPKYFTFDIFGRSRLPKNVRQIIVDSLQESTMQPWKSSIKKTWNDISIRLRSFGITETPSYRTACRWINRFRKDNHIPGSKRRVSTRRILSNGKIKVNGQWFFSSNFQKSKKIPVVVKFNPMDAAAIQFKPKGFDKFFTAHSEKFLVDHSSAKAEQKKIENINSILPIVIKEGLSEFSWANFYVEALKALPAEKNIPTSFLEMAQKTQTQLLETKSTEIDHFIGNINLSPGKDDQIGHDGPNVSHASSEPLEDSK